MRIIIFMSVLCMFCSGCGNVDQESRWQRLGRRCMGTAGFGVPSAFVDTLNAASPLTRNDVIEASSLLCSLLIDKEFSDYTLETCNLDAGLWNVVFKRAQSPSSRIDISLVAISGYVFGVKTIGIPINRRTPLYCYITGANKILARSIPESGSLAAALCARDIASILDDYCQGWQVGRTHFNEITKEWEISLYHPVSAKRIILDENLMLLEYGGPLLGSE